MTAKNMWEKPATTQIEDTAIIPIAEIASTTEWMNQVVIINRHSTDLVNTDVVQQGYMMHGHPSSMGFVHLNKMTQSRLKKRFPFYDKSDPLYAMLEARIKLIVGKGIVKKYEARRDGVTGFDYSKWIDDKVEQEFEEFINWRPHYLEIANGTSQESDD